MEQSLPVRLKIWAGFFLTAGNLMIIISRYAIAFIKVEQYVMPTSPLYIMPCAAVPFLWWAYSTKSDDWNYYNRKLAALYIAILNGVLTVLVPLWTLLFNKIVVGIAMHFTVGRNLTENMILWLCRMAQGGVVFGIAACVCYAAYTKINDDLIIEKIQSWRWTRVVDPRKDKEYAYDLGILWDLETGKIKTIKERDRMTHIIADGAPGTGKTSSTAIPLAIGDLNQKIKNGQKRWEALLEMVKKGHAYIRNPKDIEPELEAEAIGEGFSDDIRAEVLVVPKEGYEKEFIEIKKKYPDCGMTIMAPNESMNEDIIKIARARNITVNIIDPSKEYTGKNVKNLGMNPFYISPELSPQDRVPIIMNAAKAFAEVMTAVNENAGNSEDPYFKGINQSVTTNVSIVLMLDAALRGEQTNIIKVQECINEFANIAGPMKNIQDTLHMTILVQDIGDQKGKRSKPGVVDDTADLEEVKTKYKDNGVTEGEAQYKYNFRGIRDRSEMTARYRDTDISIEEYNGLLQWESEQYYETLHFVMSELLGSGQEKMTDQARGLRNLINDFLLDPRVKKLLSATDKDLINWDKALLNNDVTLINTALSLGKGSSTALGIFILLNMQLAVYRRKKDWTLTDHFLIIDEAAQYMHPMYDDIISYYRQFKVSALIMFQSFSQFDKNPSTSYLKGVFMKAGTHLIFGRIDSDEMKMYESLSGINHERMKQFTVNMNSELDENASIGRSTRVTPQDKPNLEGSKIRNRDFQEVSVFSVDNGAVIPAYIAKVRFPKKSDFNDQHIKFPDWSKYIDKDWIASYEKSVARSENRDASVDMIRSARTDIHTDNVFGEAERKNFSVPNPMTTEQEEEAVLKSRAVYDRTAEQEALREQRRKEAEERFMIDEDEPIMDFSFTMPADEPVNVPQPVAPTPAAQSQPEPLEDENIERSPAPSQEETSPAESEEEYTPYEETDDEDDEDIEAALAKLNAKKGKLDY